MQKSVESRKHGLVLFNPEIGPLSGSTTLGQCGHGSDGNKGVLRIPQSSSITGTSPSDRSVSYPGHSLGGVLPLCREAVGVFYIPGRQGKQNKEIVSEIIWTWLWRGNLKRETESLSLTIENNTKRIN